jgi:hypothetical protein
MEASYGTQKGALIKDLLYINKIVLESEQSA